MAALSQRPPWSASGLFFPPRSKFQRHSSHGDFNTITYTHQRRRTQTLSGLSCWPSDMFWFIVTVGLHETRVGDKQQC